MLNDQVAEFTHGAVASIAGKNEVCIRVGRSVGISGDHPASGRLQTADIVFVVADEYDIFGIKLMRFAPVGVLHQPDHLNLFECKY